MNDTMKKLLIATITLSACLRLGAQDHQHDHGESSKPAGHAEHQHDHNGDHAPDAREAGPNGGRIVTSVEPHFELWVQQDRKVRITFLDDARQAVAPAEQRLSAIGGSRANPTRLAFAVEGDVLISDVALPEGNTVPLIVSIKIAPDGKTVTERMNINLSDCPSCDYREYACVCGHAE